MKNEEKKLKLRFWKSYIVDLFRSRDISTKMTFRHEGVLKIILNIPSSKTHLCDIRRDLAPWPILQNYVKFCKISKNLLKC